MLLEVKKQLVASRSGFTLIEILVVIGIVAMLAVLSVGGYLQYRRSTILSLSADSMVAQIYSQKNKATLGSYKGQRAEEIRAELDKASGAVGENNVATSGGGNGGFESKCFTVLFEKGADDKFSAYLSQKDFSGKKKWEGDSWKYEGCGVSKAGDVKTPFELDSLIKIDKISIGNFSVGGDGNAISNSLEVSFLPPEGEIKVFVNGDSWKVGSADVGMKIDISYGDNNLDYQKNIFFDFVSGVSTVSSGTPVVNVAK